jgi:hypothetical protein
MIKMGGPCVLDNPESRRAEDARQRALRQVREECDREARRHETWDGVRAWGVFRPRMQERENE